MLVKNTGLRIIGFGSTVIIPDEIAPLPEGFGENHPTVKFYIKKKWLTPIESNKAPELTPEQILVKKAEEEMDENKKALDAILKEISKMNLEPLRAEATKYGIEYTEDDTKEILKNKIAEKLQAELG